MKPNPLSALYHLTEPTHSSVGPTPGCRCEDGTRGRAPLRRARHLSCTCVHLDHFGDLWALLPLADSDLDASALRHAAVSCCLQQTDVHECLGSTDHGDKPKALLGIEPFDDCFDRLRCLRRARPWIARPPFGYSILGGVIVIVTAALWLTVVFVAAHSTSIANSQQHQMSRSLRGLSQEVACCLTPRPTKVTSDIALGWDLDLAPVRGAVGGAPGQVDGIRPYPKSTC